MEYGVGYSMMSKLTPEEVIAMTDEVRKVGAKIQKACPVCGHLLMLRINRVTGEQFLVCSTWPTCTHAEPLTTYLRMRALGAPTLF